MSSSRTQTSYTQSLGIAVLSLVSLLVLSAAPALATTNGLSTAESKQAIRVPLEDIAIEDIATVKAESEAVRGVLRTFGDPEIAPAAYPLDALIHSLSNSLLLSSSSPARPYICRLSIFNRLICPST